MNFFFLWFFYYSVSGSIPALSALCLKSYPLLGIALSDFSERIKAKGYKILGELYNEKRIPEEMVKSIGDSIEEHTNGHSEKIEERLNLIKLLPINYQLKVSPYNTDFRQYFVLQFAKKCVFQWN